MARILISGASGLIGSALVRAFEARGDKVCRLVRRLPENENEVQWDPMREIPPETVSGFGAVVHLSGENVAGRWTAKKKRRIVESRVLSTRNLAQALLRAEKRPEAWLCASAIGYYGDRGDEVLTEERAPGRGFLPEVCREWEASAGPAAEAGIRVANMRFGIVLSKEGGALRQMLLPFRLGLGGRIGSGQQWWSWIHVEDVVGAVMHVLGNDAGQGHPAPGHPVSGPVNVVAPNPVRNAEFAKTLGSVMKRPALFGVPQFVVKAAFGEFAEEGLLASARVMPTRLVESGFEFRYPELGAALRALVS